MPVADCNKNTETVNEVEDHVEENLRSEDEDYNSNDFLSGCSSYSEG